jgi:hypothetical protein
MLEDEFDKTSSTQNSKFRTATTFKTKRNSTSAPRVKLNQEKLIYKFVGENNKNKKTISFRNKDQQFVDNNNRIR